MKAVVFFAAALSVTLMLSGSVSAMQDDAVKPLPGGDGVTVVGARIADAYSSALQRRALRNVPVAVGGNNLDMIFSDLDTSDEWSMVTFSLANRSDKPMSAYYFEMDSFYQLENISHIVLKYPCEVILRLTWEDEVHLSTKRTTYIPVTFSYDTNITPESDVWMIKPDEYIEGIIYFSE